MTTLEIYLRDGRWSYVLFPYLLNMTLTASVVIAAVLLLRLALRRAPKIFSYALWSVVLFRLLCPVTVGSPLSLLGLGRTGVTPDGRMAYIPDEIVHMVYPEVSLPLPGLSDAINGRLHTGWVQITFDPLEIVASFALAGLLLGGAILLIVGLGQLIGLRIRLIGAAPLAPRVRLADHIPTSFVLGLFRPVIYLPASLAEAEREHVLAHERHHIRRGDHIVRGLAYLALCLHWYNPLVWVAFVLSGRDMEMSCDEAVLRRLGDGIRADYADSLLRQSAGRSITPMVPLAFGAGQIKARVVNVLHCRRPGRWVIVGLSLLCLTALMTLAVNPADNRHLLPTADELQAATDPVLDEAVGAAVCAAFRGKDAGTYALESHLILDVRDATIPQPDRPQQLDVWALVLYEEYTAASDTPVSGCFAPARIRLYPTDDGYLPGDVTLPADGARYTFSILQSYPPAAARAALDHAFYHDALRAELDAKREKMQNPS